MLSKVISKMDVENVSVSGYTVPNGNNTTAYEAFNAFMSEAMSYTIYKIGKLTLFLFILKFLCNLLFLHLF